MGKSNIKHLKKNRMQKNSPPIPQNKTKKPTKNTHTKKKLTNNIQTKYNKQNTKTPTKTPSNFNDYYVYSVFQ